MFIVDCGALGARCGDAQARKSRASRPTLSLQNASLADTTTAVRLLRAWETGTARRPLAGLGEDVEAGMQRSAADARDAMMATGVVLV